VESCAARGDFERSGVVEVTDLAKIQKEVKDLVERRLNMNSRLEALTDEKESLTARIKEYKKEFQVIDKLFLEKLGELNGGVE